MFRIYVVLLLVLSGCGSLVRDEILRLPELSSTPTPHYLGLVHPASVEMAITPAPTELPVAGELSPSADGNSCFQPGVCCVFADSPEKTEAAYVYGWCDWQKKHNPAMDLSPEECFKRIMGWEYKWGALERCASPEGIVSREEQQGGGAGGGGGSSGNACTHDVYQLAGSPGKYVYVKHGSPRPGNAPLTHAYGSHPPGCGTEDSPNIFPGNRWEGGRCPDDRGPVRVREGEDYAEQIIAWCKRYPNCPGCPYKQ